jgi:8-oxo-dGTP pyrophosphatase MutT (NUDIX family)
MEKIKACVIIRNKTGELLLQLRDEEPAKGTWVLFGGGVHDGETAELALRREIKEELEYELGGVSFLGRYEDNGVEQIIFASDDTVEFSELSLREGYDMNFFPAEKLPSLKIGFNFKGIINDYLNKK